MRFFPWMRGPLREAAKTDGGGGGGAPTFDPNAFKSELLGEVGKLFEGLKASLKPGETAKPEPKPEPPPEPKSKDGDHDQAALLKRIADMEAEREKDRAASKSAREAARDRDRLAQIRTALSAHQYANDAAAEDAMEYFGKKLKFNDADQLVTPDGTPVKDWIGKTLANDRPHLLKPRDVGGAGAQNGGAAAGGKTINLEDIKPGMKPEDLAAAEAYVASVLKSGS